MRTLFYFLFAVSVGFTFSQGLTETHTTDIYFIRYPEKWAFTEDDELGASFHIVSPKENDNDTFRENVSLVNQDLKGTNIDLDTYIKLSEKQITSQVKDATIHRSERLKSGDFELHKIVYSGEINGLKLKLLQHYQIKNDKAFVLTFTAEQGQFDKYKLYGQQILNSFRFK